MKDKVTREMKAEMVRLAAEYIKNGGKVTKVEAGKAQGVR